MAGVRDADVPLFLAREIRGDLRAKPDPAFPLDKGWISDVEWDPARNPGAEPAWQVILRDDGIDDGELIVGSASIGISVLAGSKDNPAPAKDLARRIKTLVKLTPRAEPGNPVAAVTSCLGPYPVEEASTYARQYLAVVLSVVGDPV